MFSTQALFLILPSAFTPLLTFLFFSSQLVSSN